MKLQISAALAASLACTAPALASILTIDFEAPTSFASIDQFYNGGTDGAGASGPNLGVSFGADALAVQNDALGPYFSNAPSPLGVMAPVGSDATLNFSGPLGIHAVSFFYSAADVATVSLWSDFDGGGSLLGTINLAANAQDGCSDSAFCNWDQASIDFGANIGRSITFGDAANVAGFDDVRISVPEPSSLALLSLGIAGIGAARRKQVRRAPAAAH